MEAEGRFAPVPGKDGGTCINEAALVAAGFEYRPIRKPEDMPACFSRPICRLAMQLNDCSGDAHRQRLLPFVMRLACADTPEIERERASYIAQHMKRRVSFQRGLEVLEGALAIGRQADAPAPEEVQSRMDDTRSRAPVVRSTAIAAVPPKNAHPFGKLKSWFRKAKRQDPVG